MTVFNVLYKADRNRNRGSIKYFLYLMRRFQTTQSKLLKLIYKALARPYTTIHCLEIPLSLKVGGGLYIGHPFCITINPAAELGWNVNIHRGVLIGRENRGRRKGAPKIGNNVWIGINSAIVGNIHIGDDVLIAPNSYVNCDVPSHSLVFGNPCVIKPRENATEDYVTKRAEIPDIPIN